MEGCGYAPAMNHAARGLVEAAITALAGFAAFISPIVLTPPGVLPKAPLFPLVRESVEHLRPASFIALAVAGLLAGLLARLSWPLLGLAAVALFPMCMIAELLADPTSHSLFPFELAMYGMFSIPAILAAGLGRILRRVVIRPGRALNAAPIHHSSS